MSDNKQEVITSPVGPASSGKAGVVIAILFLLLVIGLFAYGYLQLSKVNLALAETVAELKVQAANSERDVHTLQQVVSGVQQSAAIAAERGNMTKWDVAEAKYLTKQAASQLQLTQDASLVMVLLQHASDIMQKTPDPSLDPIRQSLAANLASLQSQPQINAEQIYLQLAAIYNDIDKLPLPPTPLQYTEEANARQKDYSEAPWWKAQWHHSMDALRKIVIVRYMGANDFPLVMPEEKMYLYQNLHAQLQAAMLSVLNRNPQVYKTSLENISLWIQKYFVQSAPLTIKLLSQLHDLEALNLQPPAVDISATLQLFDQYLAQNTAPSVPAAQTIPTTMTP